MDTNEKLGLIERVDRASEDQAKRALKSMILKCTVGHATIARAIKDAVERHTPTPTIVYQQPESEDDEASSSSSHQNSNEEETDQNGSSDDEEDVPSATTLKRPRSRRSDINHDPLVEQLLLTKTKKKLKGKKEGETDLDEELENLAPSRKKKSKHMSRLGAENELRTSKALMGKPDDKSPTIIDLVTSSDDESRNTKQSKNRIRENQDSTDDDSDSDSTDARSSDSDSSDDTDSENEQQDDALPEGTGLSQECPNERVTQTNASSGDGGRDAAHSITISMEKVPNMNNGIEMSSAGLSKKRKALESALEDVPNDQPVRSATNAHFNKRPKQNHMQEPQKSPDDRKCRKCDILFPSVAQLLKHRTYCKDASSTLISHHRSEPPSGDHPRQVQPVQKTSNPTGDSFTAEPYNTLQLPSRPYRRDDEERGLSLPSPSFVHEPNNLPRGPTLTPLVLARQIPTKRSLPQGLPHRPVPKSFSHGPPRHQSRSLDTKSPKESFLQENLDNTKHQCKFCNNWFRQCENSTGACKHHPGQYGPLNERQLKSRRFKGRVVPHQPYIAWTCCFRRGILAPPCRTDKTHVPVTNPQ